MPCYNSELWVKNALDSIKNQTYPHWELIVVNDGSKDNTPDILNEYAESDERIKVFSKENGGYVSAVNYGLDKITGDYFLFLGSDDVLDTGLFEEFYDNICKISFIPDVINFRTVKVIDGEKHGIDKYTSFETTMYSNDSSLKEYYEKYPEHSLSLFVRDTSKCFKTSVLGELRYFGKYGIDADGIFSMLFCRKSKSFLSIPYNGYFWTLRSDSVSATTSPEKNIDRINNWILFYEELIKSGVTDSDNLADQEKSYINTMLATITKTCWSIKNSFRYYGFLRRSAKKAKEIALKFAPDKLKKTTTIISISPVLFSILYSIRKM